MDKISIDDVSNPRDILLLTSLECPIDNSISLKPVLCKKCETVYCTDCIEEWKKKSSNCPMRCNPIELIEIDKTVLKTQIDKIKVYCPNVNYGCLEKINFADYIYHKNTCEYKKISCNYCKVEVPGKFISEHLFGECTSYQIECSFCQSKQNLITYQSHFNHCLETIELCAQCGDFNSKDHFCLIKIETCKACNLPDFESEFINSNHSCLQNKLTLENVTVYLENIYLKHERLIVEIVNSRQLMFKAANDKFKELSNSIIHQEEDSYVTMQKKFNVVFDCNNKKMNQLKQEYNEKIDKLRKEVFEVKGLIESKKFF